MNTLRIVLYLTLASSLMLSCQKNTEQKEETTQVDSTQKKQEEPAANTSNYAKLILGRWAMPADDGFEPWAFYDAEKVYGDGNEQGTEYQIEGDKMIYRVLGGGKPAEYKIITLNEKILTLQIDETGEQTWTKADSDKEIAKKEEPKKPAKVDAKLLVGTWVNEQETDDFSKQRIYKANGKMDLTPYNDIYGYKVVGNLIKYSKIRADGDGPQADDVITSLTKTELVLNGKLKFKRTK